MRKRAHVYYTGSVQGVGFRFTAEELAASFGVTGWVRNLRDGRVEVMGEADEKMLQVFLDKITGIFGHYINDARVEWSDASNEFETFDVRF